jgi:hypothetical protein
MEQKSVTFQNKQSLDPTPKLAQLQSSSSNDQEKENENTSPADNRTIVRAVRKYNLDGNQQTSETF